VLCTIISGLRTSRQDDGHYPSIHPLFCFSTLRSLAVPPPPSRAVRCVSFLSHLSDSPVFSFIGGRADKRVCANECTHSDAALSSPLSVPFCPFFFFLLLRGLRCVWLWPRGLVPPHTCFLFFFASPLPPPLSLLACCLLCCCGSRFPLPCP
jgi:hypothetical protein